jgi:hypothetical protein
MNSIQESIFHIRFLLTEPITPQEEKELLAELELLKQMKQELSKGISTYGAYFKEYKECK